MGKKLFFFAKLYIMMYDSTHVQNTRMHLHGMKCLGEFSLDTVKEIYFLLTVELYVEHVAGKQGKRSSTGGESNNLFSLFSRICK